jgi:hypothetical protein
MAKREFCISCGRQIEYAGQGPEALPNHHCAPRHEAAVEAAQRVTRESHERERSFAQRLEEGFAMLGAHFELLTPDDPILPAAS